jgi:hypothetical protein
LKKVSLKVQDVLLLVVISAIGGWAMEQGLTQPSHSQPTHQDLIASMDEEQKQALLKELALNAQVSLETD